LTKVNLMTGPVNVFNVYVEKIVLKNQLVPEKKLAQAKAYLVTKPEFTLMEVLVKAKCLSARHSDLIAKKFEDYSSKRSLQNKTVKEKPVKAAKAEVEVSEKSTATKSMGKAAAESSNNDKKAELEAQDTVDYVFSDNSEPEVDEGDSREEAAVLNADDNLFESLEQCLQLVIDMKASDLHISVNTPPMVRKNGRLCPIGSTTLSAEDTERLLFQVLRVNEKQDLIQHKKLDVCLTINSNRYRSCFVKQRAGWDATFRLIKSDIPEFFELGLPEDLKKLTDYNEGLILIAGPNRSGISTTMAAFVNLINKTRNAHIITLEKPVEHVFKPDKSHISQREVGIHTQNYSMALRAAMREDPDVIIVGELHDRETTSLAVTAAETGHLVLATMHTISAAQTIERLLHYFPPEQRAQIRSMISESFRGIICQRLIPRSDGRGLALALEILKNNASVANLIREDRLFQIANVMQTNSLHGMRQLDDSINQLLKTGIISGEEAFFAAYDRERFAKWAPKIKIM